MIFSENVGGTSVLFSSTKNYVIFGNSKNNTFSVYDLERNSILRTIDVNNLTLFYENLFNDLIFYREGLVLNLNISV